MATVVAFHAHPGDEVVLTGGTLARAAAAGHRVVVVAATDGRVHNREDGIRLAELRSSAAILGVHGLNAWVTPTAAMGRSSTLIRRVVSDSGERIPMRRHGGWPRYCARKAPIC